MRSVWIVAAAWVVLSIPIGLLVGRWLRSLGNDASGPPSTGGAPAVRRRRGGPTSLAALLPGVHTGQPRRQAPGIVPATTNPRPAALSHRPRRPPSGSGPPPGDGTATDS